MAHSTTLTDRQRRLADARLYLVCDTAPATMSLEQLIARAIAGGVDIVQIREKHLSDDALIPIATRATELCRELGALSIVNDRPEVALAAGADGLHIGQKDIPVAEARTMIGEELLLGRSTHSPSQIDEAARLASDPVTRIDYIGVGPVHLTPTKPGRAAVGTSLLSYAAAKSELPFFAIGGLNEGNVAQALDAGACRVCVVRAITQATDPHASALALRTLVEHYPLR